MFLFWTVFERAAPRRKVHTVVMSVFSKLQRMVSGEQVKKMLTGVDFYTIVSDLHLAMGLDICFSVWAHQLQCSGSRYTRMVKTCRDSANSAHPAKHFLSLSMHLQRAATTCVGRPAFSVAN
jgi:hypothetical protein